MPKHITLASTTRGLLAPLLFVSSLGSGCTLSLDYNQCQTDDECKAKGSGAPYCTADHICVSDTPTDKLCEMTPYPKMSTRTKVNRIGAIMQLGPDGKGPDQNRMTLIKFAVDEINDQVAAFSDNVGQVELYVCNVNSPNDAVNALRLLVTKNQIVTAIGPSSYDTVKALLEVAPALQVPVLAPAATAGALSGQSKLGYVFFMAPLDPGQAPKMATAVQNKSTVTVLTQQGAYGQSLQQAFVTEYNKREPTNNVGVSVRTPFDDSEAGVAALQDLAQMLAPQVPIISYMILLITPSRVAAVKSLQDMPYDSKNTSKTTQLILSDGGRSGEMLDLAAAVQQAASADMADAAAQKALTNLFRVRGVSVAPLLSNTPSTAFKEPFKIKYPGVNLSRDLYATFGYDALYTAALSIDSVQLAAGTATSGAEVAKVLRRISTQGKEIASLGYAAYPGSISKIAKGEQVQLEGLTGLIGFDLDGTRQGATFEDWWINFKPTPPEFVNTDPRAPVGM